MKIPAEIVVDANPIISALIGGAANRVFWDSDIQQFLTTAWTVQEVERYIPKLAHKSKTSESMILSSLYLLPLQIRERDTYSKHLKMAEQQIKERDPKDIDILALALSGDWSLWTNDRDFEVTTVKRFSTSQLLTMMEEI